MVMKALVLFSLTQCLTAVFLGYQGEVEWLGGRRGGLGKDCKGPGCLRKMNVEACEGAVKDPKRALCFASGGLNPNINGDKDHYEEEAWTDFPKGGIPRFNFHTQLTNMDCMYCPAVGYWPEAEQSMMISCNKDEMGNKVLLKHCVFSGVLLHQDAVLYRPPDRGVQMYKTYKQGMKWKEKLTNDGTLDEKALLQGAFGDPDFKEIKADAEKFGTVFDSCPTDVEAQQFVFYLDEARTIFCRDECMPAPGFVAKCAIRGEGGRVQGLPCDVLCKPPPMQGETNECVPKKRGSDICKLPFSSEEERKKVMAKGKEKAIAVANQRKANEEKGKTMMENLEILEKEREKVKKNVAKAKAKSLGRRLLRWLRGRARLAQ